MFLIWHIQVRLAKHERPSQKSLVALNDGFTVGADRREVFLPC
jgi:hypothetical protein